MNPTLSIAKRAAEPDQGSTRRIPRAEWSSFFDSFSRLHKDGLVSMELMAPELGDAVEVHDRPLSGITAELSRGGRDSIVILLGPAPGHLTHIIQRPICVWLKQTADGTDEALEIEAANAPTTLLRFRSP